MDSQLVCTSHSPILYLRPEKPDYEDEIFRTLAERRAAVEAFGPAIAFVFGADHYAGFHLNAMPEFLRRPGRGGGGGRRRRDFRARSTWTERPRSDCCNISGRRASTRRSPSR